MPHGERSRSRRRERSRSRSRSRSKSRKERRRKSKWDDSNVAPDAALPGIPGAVAPVTPQDAPDWVKEMFQPRPQLQLPVMPFNPILQQALMRPMGSVEKAVFVEDSLVGKLIGKAGVNIDRLRRDSGADIQFDKAAIPGGVRRVILTGAAEQVAEGERLIQQAVQQIMDSGKVTGPSTQPVTHPGQPPQVTREIKLSPTLVGAFIGPKGAHVSTLREKVGVRLEVRNDHQTTPGADATIVIGPGAELSIDAAMHVVQESIDSIRTTEKSKGMAAMAAKGNPMAKGDAGKGYDKGYGKGYDYGYDKGWDGGYGKGGYGKGFYDDWSMGKGKSPYDKGYSKGGWWDDGGKGGYWDDGKGKGGYDGGYGPSGYDDRGDQFDPNRDPYQNDRGDGRRHDPPRDQFEHDNYRPDDQFDRGGGNNDRSNEQTFDPMRNFAPQDPPYDPCAAFYP